MLGIPFAVVMFDTELHVLPVTVAAQHRNKHDIGRFFILQRGGMDHANIDPPRFQRDVRQFTFLHALIEQLFNPARLRQPLVQFFPALTVQPRASGPVRAVETKQDREGQHHHHRGLNPQEAPVHKINLPVGIFC